MNWISGWLFPAHPAALEEAFTHIEAPLAPPDPKDGPKDDPLYPVKALRELLDTLTEVSSHLSFRKMAQHFAQLSDEQIEVNFLRFATPIVLHIVFSDEELIPQLKARLSMLPGPLTFLLRPLVALRERVWNTYHFDQAQEALKRLEANAESKEKLYALSRRELTGQPYTPQLLGPLREIRQEMTRDEREYLMQRLYIEIYKAFIENGHRIPYEWMPPVRYLNPVKRLLCADPTNALTATYYLDRYSSGWGVYLLKQSQSSGLLEVQAGRLTHRCRFLLMEGDERISRQDLVAIETLMLKAIKENIATPRGCLLFLKALKDRPIEENPQHYALVTINNFSCFQTLFARIHGTSILPSKRR